MRAELIEKSRTDIDEATFYEIVVWQLPSPVPGCIHSYKYRFALVVNDECVLRYDNERGKGDHKHFENREEPIEFTSIEAVYKAFRADVKRILK